MNLENAFQKDIESSSGIILDECITPLADGDYISACGIRHYETANRLLHGLLILPPDYPRSLTTYFSLTSLLYTLFESTPCAFLCPYTKVTMSSQRYERVRYRHPSLTAQSIIREEYAANSYFRFPRTIQNPQ
jgi:hypothetical protein